MVDIKRELSSYAELSRGVLDKLSSIQTLVSLEVPPTEEDVSTLNSLLADLRGAYDRVRREALSDEEEDPDDRLPVQAYVDIIERRRLFEQLDVPKNTLRRFVAIRSNAPLFSEALAPYQIAARKRLEQLEDLHVSDLKKLSKGDLLDVTNEAMVLKALQADTLSTADGMEAIDAIEGQYPKLVIRGLLLGTYYTTDGSLSAPEGSSAAQHSDTHNEEASVTSATTPDSTEPVTTSKPASDSARHQVPSRTQGEASPSPEADSNHDAENGALGAQDGPLPSSEQLAHPDDGAHPATAEEEEDAHEAQAAHDEPAAHATPEDPLIARLRCTPVTQLALGTTRLRRTIAAAGFTSIVDLFEQTDSVIDRSFDLGTGDDIFALKQQYHKDPIAFARRAFQREGEHGPTSQNEFDAVPQRKVPTIQHQHLEQQRRDPLPHRFAASKKQYALDQLADTPVTIPLKRYEQKCRTILDDLDDRYESVLVYQAFEELYTELDDLRDAFVSFFRSYRERIRIALTVTERYLGNAYLVFFADQARKAYDGRELWGNFFSLIGIADQNIWTEFKRLFAEKLKMRGMPLYASGEEAFYYLYTTLLHGGLSESAWKDLWSKSLIPLSKSLESSQYGYASEISGYTVLRLIKDADSKYAPGKAVLSILAKAPNSTIAPLFESSIRVAAQYTRAANDASAVTMLSSYGLPDIAISALQSYREVQQSTPSSTTRGGNHLQNSEARRIVYLPMARLRLDVEQGKVLISWPRQQFPLGFAGSRMDYYVDGHRVLQKPFETGVGKCILDAVELPVAPQARYDVELRLLQSDGQTDTLEETSSLQQTFRRNKPHCFEFIRGRSGAYHLRGKDEQIRSERRVAYIVEEGYAIQPGAGMAALSRHETDEMWGQSKILLFDVKPGATGALIASATGEEAAVWHETYNVKVNRHSIIGQTVGGLDLYGSERTDEGHISGLPSVTIEAADGSAALYDLTIGCLCGGKRISLPRRILWADEYEQGRATIVIRTDAVVGFESHMEQCELFAQRKSDGSMVFRYRFCAIPIKGFRVSSLAVEQGIVTARYQFIAIEQLVVVMQDGTRHGVNAGMAFEAKTLLKDEVLPLSIESVLTGRRTDALLSLAAIDLKLPDKLLEVSAKRPLCLADALDMGPSAANVKVSAYGGRYNRAVLIRLGLTPLFFKELTRPSEHWLNLFKHVERFVQQGNTAKELPLTMTVFYGDETKEGTRSHSWVDIDLLSCQEGFGFTSLEIAAKQDGREVLMLDKPCACDLHIDFRRQRRDYLIESVDVAQGATEIPVPASVTRLLDTRKGIDVVVAPQSWFDGPDYQYATTLSLRK